MLNEIEEGTMGKISDFDKSGVEESGEFSEEDANFCLQMWNGRLEQIFFVEMHEMEEDTTGQKQEETNIKNKEGESSQ